MLGIDVNLVNALQVDLYGILCGGYVALHRVQNIQASIQRYGFARTRRAGYQNHALGSFQRRHIHLFLIVFIPQCIDAHFGTFGIKNTQHDLLAPQGGKGVHAKVDCLVFGNLQFNPAVLWLAPFGQVHGRHNFQARGDTNAQLLRGLCYFMQDAVGAKAHAVGFFIRLEMKIGGTHAHRVQQHLVDETDYRRIVGISSHVLLIVFSDCLNIQIIKICICHVTQAASWAVEVFLNSGVQLIVFDYNGICHQPGVELNVAKCLLVGRV